MREYRELWRVLGFAVTLGLSLGSGEAKKPPKAYPEEGKVVGSDIRQHMASFPGPHGVETRTYKIETSAKIYVLDCGNRDGCGGTKKIQLGDVIHFRIGNGSVYILAPDGSNNNHEDKLRILSEELKSQAKVAD